MPAMVRTVKRTSPADNAGLDRGDYILKVGMFEELTLPADVLYTHVFVV